jgi:TRAP-type mannitol/chloroaromatic compound transport system substrate-binding protein
MGKINRSKFFKGVAAGIIGLPMALKALTQKDTTQQKTSGLTYTTAKTNEWKMVTTWPPNFPIIGEACNRLADLVESLSNSRIKIRVYGGGELVPSLEAFDAVKNGVAEIGSGSPYYWAGKIPAAQFFSTVPFGMNAQQMNAWILVGEGYNLWKEVYQTHNLIPFPGGNTGVQMGGWFNKPIESVSDLKSLKMRIPGIGGKVLEKAGGTPVLLAGGELYTGLERGIIDATEWLGPFHDQSMGFQDIAKYYYAPGWHEPGTLLEFFLTAFQRRLSIKILKEVMVTTTHLTSMVFFILIGATTFSFVFRELGGDSFLVHLIQEADISPNEFLFVVMIVVFVAGFFIDFIEIIFIIVPVVAPIFIALEIDLIWVGILLAINLQTSFLTPPFGFSLFYLRGVAPPEVTTSHLYKGILPFIIIQLLFLGLIVSFPEIIYYFL